MNEEILDNSFKNMYVCQMYECGIFVSGPSTPKKMSFFLSLRDKY